MTTQPTSRATITLPLLMDYIDVLLPSLAIQVATPETPEQTAIRQTSDSSDGSSELLWVVQDKAERLALQTSLKNLDNKKGKTHLSTLSELTQQQLPERYELACFWLPTLSAELLPQYIPLLMRYRDLYAAHLLIALDSTLDLKSYGFTPFDILSEPSLKDAGSRAIHASSSTDSLPTLWQFNLYDYKQLPNWLNADYWANPENWGKHRW
ncbi:DUF6231 family protein [Psychrobacter sp. W2-37-MNA-CIBAN-0211]|uniref:DUF6231 family protein n=1 Tax=Psychrobacter sp. W2-37-MNA-CIBAN-0211 TaxID=3140443 RepID=UPI003327AC90